MTHVFVRRGWDTGGAGVFVTGANIQDKKQVWTVLISDQDWSFFFFFFSVLYIENIFLYLKILQMNWFGNSGRRVKTKGNNNENMMPASQNTYVGCMWVPGSHADLIPDGRWGARMAKRGGRPGSWHSRPLSLSSRLVPYEGGCSQISMFLSAKHLPCEPSGTFSTFQELLLLLSHRILFI